MWFLILNMDVNSCPAGCINTSISLLQTTSRPCGPLKMAEEVNVSVPLLMSTRGKIPHEIHEFMQINYKYKIALP